MRQSTRKASVRGAIITLWLAAAVLTGVSCRADEATQPTASTASELRPTAGGSAALSFRQMDAGELHVCGVTTSYQAYCWGWNSNYGALGDGTRTNSSAPVLVLGGLHFRQVSAGSSHTCAVTTDNRGYCWGGGHFGQLGDGSTGSSTGLRLKPVAVTGGLLFQQLSTGSAHTCGLTTSHKVYCWGINTYGQLGDGTTINRLRPVLISGGRSFRAVSAGDEHSCAVTTTYQAFCWGRNANGRLGDGSTVSQRLRPVAVAGTFAFKQLSAGRGHTCGVTTDARAFCWGDGTFGQLGGGNEFSRKRPGEVTGGLRFDRVTAGGYHTCGETTANRGYCWGNGAFGSLGDGLNTSRLTPGAVAGGLQFSQLTLGVWLTCGITPLNRAYCWGYNNDGQVGDGTNIERDTPVPVVGPS